MLIDTSQALWTVTDPINRPIVLLPEGEAHILSGHPEIGPNVQSNVKQAIEKTVFILPDPHNPDRNIYSCPNFIPGISTALWMKTVVQFDRAETGQVTTSYVVAMDDLPKVSAIWLDLNYLKK